MTGFWRPPPGGARGQLPPPRYATGVEHFYQFEFCMNCDRPDLAHKVIEAQTPKLAKQIAAELKGRISPDHIGKWLSKRILVMENALKLKWNSCAKFRHVLMQTSGMAIAEATQDTFWGVGVAPNLAQETRRGKFIGDNHLGRLLMGLRDYVASCEPESLSDAEFADNTTSSMTSSSGHTDDSAVPPNITKVDTESSESDSSSRVTNSPTMETPPPSEGCHEAGNNYCAKL